MEQFELEELNQSKKKNLENSTKRFKSVGFFKLQYHFLRGKDYILIILAVIGSLGTGIALPLFALFFGQTVSDLTYVVSTIQFVEYFKEMCFRFIYVGIGALVSGIMMVTLWTYNGRVITKRLREHYVKVLLLQEQAFFDQTNTHEFCFKIQNQILAIENGMGQKVGDSLFAITMFISSFIVGYYTSWKLSLVITSTISVFFFGGWLIDRLIRYNSKKVEQCFEEAGGVAEEVIYNIKTVTSFANYDYELKRYNDKIDLGYKYSIAYGKISSIAIGIYLFFILNTFSLAVWYGGVLIKNKEQNTHAGTQMYVGDILVVVFTIVFGSLALGQASPNLKAISNACIAAYDYFALTERVPEIDLSNSNMKPDKDSLKGVIEIKSVTFNYPSKSEKEVLRDINIKIDTKKKIAIVGQSGSGKSTITSLIMRLYDPLRGEILFDNINIKNLDLEYYRSLIAYAPQEPILFNISIRENIIFGRENVTEEELKSCMQLAYAEDFINEKGLDYLVGIKGSKLSSGQRQRIGLARALLKKPKIIILDEPTSSLDYESERLIQEAIDKISKEVSCLIIANRLSTIINSDYIYVVNNTEIAEEGNHVTLLEKNGLYKALIKNQLEEMHSREAVQEEAENENNGVVIIVTQENHFNENLKLISDNKENFINGDSADVPLPKSEETKLKRTFLDLLYNFKCWLVITIIFLSCMGAIWPAYGLMLAGVFNALATPNPEEAEANGSTMALYFLLLAGFTAIFYSLQSYFLIYLGENITMILRKQLYEKFLSFHMGYFDFPENSPSILISRLNSDTSNITGIALSMVGLSIQMLMALLVGIILSFIYDWRLCLIAIAFMPLTAIATICTWRSKKKVKEAAEKIENESSALLMDSICNTKVVFAYNMQRKLGSVYKEVLDQFDGIIVKASWNNGISFGIVLLVMFVSFGVLFYAGASFIGQLTILLDNMLKSIFSILFALFGISMGQQYIGDISKVKAAVNSIFKTLNDSSQINPMDSQGKKTANGLKGKIEFRNVSFAYPSNLKLDSNAILLKNINFTINPGERAAFIGFSGSGKSTIIQLIERFYDATSGQVFIDDVCIKEYDLVSLRNSIGAVMEDPALFKTNAEDNIRYGKLNATPDEIQSCTQKALIDHLVTKGVKGKAVPMSGGERQRLALARALIKQPKIILLDEATSALDKNSEEIIKRSLPNLLHDMTTVMVAHNLSLIENFDLIFMMENGEIVERGRHSDLINLKGRYYNLFNSSRLNTHN